MTDDNDDTETVHRSDIARHRNAPQKPKLRAGSRALHRRPRVLDVDLFDMHLLLLLEHDTRALVCGNAAIELGQFAEVFHSDPDLGHFKRASVSNQPAGSFG